tara:strand:+ start:220 stop:1548 length:1329 start_codon:yes stop_codon:yes gene_type:complete
MKKSFLTFAAFLMAKSITTESFDEMEAGKRLELFGEHSKSQEDYISQLENDVNNKMSKEDIEKLQKDLEVTRGRENKALKDAVSTQGVELKKMQDIIKGGKMDSSVKSQIDKFIADNSDEIKEMKNQGHGFIEFQTKAPAAITTGSALNPDGIPEIAGVQMAPPTNVNLRRAFVDTLVNMFNTNLPAYPYTESIPLSGDFGWIGEGELKPQIDFKMETRYAEPKKIAAFECLTDEAVQDIAGLQSIATNYLRAKHDLKRQNGILFGTGVGNEPTGATTYGRLFNAGAMANCVVTPNFMDVVNAIMTDIFVTPNYQDEMEYVANIVMINPIDFYCELVSAKDGEGRPLYPMAALFNRVVIGSSIIIPEQTIPTGKVFVSDMSKYHVTNYIPYTVRIGWINDDFIKNQFCMVGESRLHAFVKKLDEAAFVYDDIAVVKAAITKP